jgi:hypothetical protein
MHEMITVQDRLFYPDYLEQAVVLYEPVFERFAEIFLGVSDSAGLLRAIVNEPQPMRTQLLRIFRKYVAPTCSVEMLKRANRVEEVIVQFGEGFRAIEDVASALQARPNPDEALAAVFWEHHDRGTPGYKVTTFFFEWFELQFATKYTIVGPRAAGQDVQLRATLPKFRDDIPADFMITRKSDRSPLVVGFAHYDSDRGGSQEDDRTGGNQDKVNKIMQYASRRRVPLKVLFINDGPGLLLGSMWRDYANLEQANIVDGEVRVMVLTLKMLAERLTESWIESAN